MRMGYCFVGAGVVACLLVHGVCESQLANTTAAESVDTAQRTRSGLVALYDFSLPSGEFVKDRSGVGDPVNLRITNPQAVRRSKGSLEVRAATLIRSDKPATRVIDAIRRSGEITVEAWIRPANTNQDGPARIVTLSNNATLRNFTLGQDGDKIDARPRLGRDAGGGMRTPVRPI